MDRTPDTPRRARRRRLARTAGRAALAAGALALVLAFAAGSWTVRQLDRAELGFRIRLRARLVSKHGLLLYAPFDAGIPLDEATGIPLDGVGTKVVPGRRREARRFTGADNQALGTDIRWNRFAENGGTVFLWADLADTGREQRIVWDRTPAAGAGLRLLPDRTLEAVYTDADGMHALAAPLPPAGRFVPVGFVFGHDRAALWIDGREVASAPVSGGLRLPYHAISFGPSEFYPLVGALDEASAWDHPLPAAELEALSSSGRAVDGRLEPWRRLRADAARALSRGFRTAARILDRLVPSRGGPAVLRQDVPELDLVLSKKDARHAIAAHEQSLRAGYRTRAASRDRAVLVRWRGRDVEAAFSFDDAYGPASTVRPDSVRRPTVLLRAEPGSLAPGSGLARLVPPERYGTLHPDAPDALPPASNLVRVLLDGEFRGLFVLEPFDRTGGAWRANGVREAQRPDHLFYGSQSDAGAPAGAADRRRALSLLLSDPRFPWSAAEARWRSRIHGERRAELAFAPPELSALDLMGDNPSPFYVTNDVDLAAAGPGVSWRSSDPATLDVDGTVCPACCEGDLPRTVELTGTFPDGTERTFRFRVMPEKPRLPAIFLHVGAPVRKNRRTDFTAARIAAGGGAADVLLGTASTGGGLRHRGNTSYVRGARRSLSLEFDRPVAWAGAPDPAAHVLLLSGYADATRLRNALSFDAFAAMRPDAPRGAVPVSWTEVFVNGEYAGVWETCPRLKDVVSAWAGPIYKVRTPAGLWSRVSADMLDRRDGAAPGEPDAADAYDPFLELARFAIESGNAEFAARAGERFDLDGLADMYLLLNFTGNMDGRITNQYVVRRRADGRWLALPWDYDKTFLDDKTRDLSLSNALYERCLRIVPGFRKRVADRWAALRAGPLSDDAIDRWLDERSSHLAPFMDEDFRIVPPADFGGTYPQAVESLRNLVHHRARRLDERLGLRPAP